MAGRETKRSILATRTSKRIANIPNSDWQSPCFFSQRITTTGTANVPRRRKLRQLCVAIEISQGLRPSFHEMQPVIPNSRTCYHEPSRQARCLRSEGLSIRCSIKEGRLKRMKATRWENRMVQLPRSRHVFQPPGTVRQA